MNVEKVHDLNEATESQKAPAARAAPSRKPGKKRHGILPTRGIRVSAFAVISLTLFGCAVLCLLAVWDYTASGTAWRAFASLGIITATMVMFVFVNEVFGASVRGEQ